MTFKGFTTTEFTGQYGRFATREEQDFDVGQFLDRLRYDPEKWARYPDPVHRPTVIERVRRGNFPDQIPGEFQVKSIRADGAPNTSYKWLYAKYVGPRPENASWIAPRPVGVELDFQDPPMALGRPPSPMRQFLEQIKHYPGLWCRTKDPIPGSYTTSVIQGRPYGQKPGSFDATVRSLAGVDGAPAMYMYAMFLDPAQAEEDPSLLEPIPEDEWLFEIEVCPLIERRAPYMKRIMSKPNAPKSMVSQWLEQTVRRMPPEKWAIYPWPHNRQVPRGIELGTSYGAKPTEFEVKEVDMLDVCGTPAKVLVARKRVHGAVDSSDAALREILPTMLSGAGVGDGLDKKLEAFPTLLPNEVGTYSANNRLLDQIVKAGLQDELVDARGPITKIIGRYCATQQHLLEGTDPDDPPAGLDQFVKTIDTHERREEFLDSVSMSTMLCGVQVLPDDFGPVDENGRPFGSRADQWFSWELPPEQWA